MAVWQIMHGSPLEPLATQPLYDDGATAQPGDAEFSSDAVVAYAATLGAGYGFNYVGQSAD
jgi:hypothetical protein